jgi:TRAP transporter 4TM/12TM fusion protein
VSSSESSQVSPILGNAEGSRYLKGVAIAIAILAVGLSVFHIWAAIAITPPALRFRSAHVAFVVPLTFLTLSFRKANNGRPSKVDLALAAVSLVPCLYLWIFYDDIISRWARVTDLTSIQVVFGVMLIVLVLEGSRRAVGPPLPIIALIAIAYAYLGPYIPGPLRHGGYSFHDIIEQLYLLTEGIFGPPIAVSARFLVIFILFGAFLTQAGAGTFFTDLASSLVGDTRGGVAKVSVLSSSLFGTISGASVANVAVTGTFTIPAMVRAGFPPRVAGAVESVASSGGSLMPPIMGAAAFLVVEFTGIPYGEVIQRAIIPALLYYISIFAFIHFESLKRGIHAPAEEAPPAFTVLKTLGHVVIIPTGVMVYMILSGFTPTYAAWVAIVLILVMSMLRKSSRLGPRKILAALHDGGVRVVPVAMACACAGIVTGMILLTGIGLRMSTMLLSAFGHSMFLLLFVTMLAAIVLGMGMPSPAAYVIAATLLAPALVEFGIPVIAAHLFVFYFAILSAITPPVALAAFTASSISGANPMSTGFTAFRFGIVSFIIPYFFVYTTEFLLIGAPLRIGMAFVTGVVGVIGIAVAMQGFWRVQIRLIERIPVLAGSLLLVSPGLRTNLLGVALLGGMAAWKLVEVRIHPEIAEPTLAEETEQDDGQHSEIDR